MTRVNHSSHAASHSLEGESISDQPPSSQKLPSQPQATSAHTVSEYPADIFQQVLLDSALSLLPGGQLIPAAMLLHQAQTLFGEAKGKKDSGTKAPTETPSAATELAKTLTLSVGAEGDNVKALQNSLHALGFKVKADGEFGPRTEKALKAFQQANGLPGTGKLDNATGAALTAALERQNRPGALSRQYEAQGPGTVSSGKGDAGGVSYGSYQLATNRNRPQEFVEYLRSADPATYHVLKDLKPGSAEFSAAWRALAKADPNGFDALQHAFIEKTHYQVGAEHIESKTGLDLNARSKALRDVAWSTAVQHGPLNTVFENALKGHDIDKLSDAEIIRLVYAERGRKTEDGTLRRFPNCSQSVQDGVAKRYANEMREALARLHQEQRD
jgi:hypothetical protein